MKKKGFTLVEIMVVIVIMGVLAAIGVPKLTSAIAKSKASEVIPAATTYIKLQDAYITERKKVGTWKRIGFKNPKSDVFKYEKGDITKSKGLDEADGMVGFKATNKVALGSCPQDQEWTVTIKVTSENDKYNIDYETAVTDANCVALSGGTGVVSKETQVAATSDNKRLNPLQTSMYSQKYEADGTQSLSRAILSGNSSTRIGAVYSEKNSTAEQKSFSDHFNIDGFVLNEDAKTDIKDWLKTQLPDGSVDTYIKLVTVLGDENDRNGLVAGKVYKGTQSLYYGGETSGGSSDLQALGLYGTREVYGKVVKFDSYGRPVMEYYADEALTQRIDVNTNTEFEKYEEDDPDPMLAEWNYDSPMSKAHLDNSISSLVVSNKNSSNADFTEHNVEGFIMNESVKQYVVKDKDADGNQLYKTDENGEYVLNKDGKKIELSHQEDYAVYAWMKTLIPAGSNTDYVKVVSEIHTKDKELTLGTTYAATQSLFYGKSTNGNVYATRNVYALVTGKAPSVRYYTDKECLHQINLKESTEGWIPVN